MDEGRPVTAKHLVGGESLEEREEETPASQARSFVEELKTHGKANYQSDTALNHQKQAFCFSTNTTYEAKRFMLHGPQ